MTRRVRALPLAVAAGAALLPVLLPHPFVLTIATQAAIWALLAASWDLLSGYTGQISFGHAGFFALGAYAAAASTKHADVSPWLGLLVAALIAAAVGLLTGFPALRLRGHYLALVTLGLAEIIRLVAQNWMALTGGPFGIHDFRSFPGLPAAALAYRQAMYRSRRRDRGRLHRGHVSASASGRTRARPSTPSARTKSSRRPSASTRPRTSCSPSR